MTTTPKEKARTPGWLGVRAGYANLARGFLAPALEPPRYDPRRAGAVKTRAGDCSDYAAPSSLVRDLDLLSSDAAT